MLSGFLLGIVHDRKLMREAQVNIAIRWFAGYGLHEMLPDHSSLTRIRQRWGAELFRAIFIRTVRACVAAGIAKGEVVHIDATRIRADVAWESLGERHVDAVLSENGIDRSNPEGGEATAEVAKRRAERNGKQTGRYKKICLTDPDATMATSARNRRLEPAFKQHTAVDDMLGVVLDLEVMTGKPMRETISCRRSMRWLQSPGIQPRPSQRTKAMRMGKSTEVWSGGVSIR